MFIYKICALVEAVLPLLNFAAGGSCLSCLGPAMQTHTHVHSLKTVLLLFQQLVEVEWWKLKLNICFRLLAEMIITTNTNFDTKFLAIVSTIYLGPNFVSHFFNGWLHNQSLENGSHSELSQKIYYFLFWEDIMSLFLS